MKPFNHVNAKTAKAASQEAVTGAVPLSMNAYKVEITKTLVKSAILFENPESTLP